MRLVHAADLHLDSPLRGLSRLGDDDLAETLRSASRRAMERLVRLVLGEQAPVLLLAGDVYDGDWHDYSTGRFFVEQMDLLHDAGVRVFMVAGNHDAESEITRALRLPPNVTVLDTETAQTVLVDDLGLAVHGRGFPTRAVMENLAVSYPHRVPGLVNVGLLHTSVDGTEGHARYAPCRLPELTGLGYDYFALGHVHQHRVLADGEHTVAYSGNLQGRHPREAGPKGALVVDLGDGPARTELHAVDVARWASLDVLVDGLPTLDAVLDATGDILRTAVTGADGRPLVVRLTLAGRTGAAAELEDSVRVREEVDRLARHLGTTVERVRVATRPPNAPDPTVDDLRSAVRDRALRLADDPDGLRSALRALDAEVGRQLREADLLDLNHPETLAALAARAADSLDALLDGGG